MHYQTGMRSYRRRLPHRDVPNAPTFVTWRLFGSLPPERIFHPEHLTSGTAFVAFDRVLDNARRGPLHLRQPEIADLVQGSLFDASNAGLCELIAHVIMPNHVHVLWIPRISLPVLIRKIKGPTAHSANRLLGLSGVPFWQPEFFDRLVRNGAEMARIHRYIEWNPVSAGLVVKPEDFPWSSAAGPGSKACAG